MLPMGRDGSDASAEDQNRPPRPLILRSDARPTTRPQQSTKVSARRSSLPAQWSPPPTTHLPLAIGGACHRPDRPPSCPRQGPCVALRRPWCRYDLSERNARQPMPPSPQQDRQHGASRDRPERLRKRLDSEWIRRGAGRNREICFPGKEPEQQRTQRERQRRRFPNARHASAQRDRRVCGRTARGRARATRSCS